MRGVLFPHKIVPLRPLAWTLRLAGHELRKPTLAGGRGLR